MILKIQNTKFDHFAKVTVNLKHDAVASSFSFEAYYNPDNPAHARLMNYGGYLNASVELDGETLITGTILNHGAPHEPVDKLINLSGYSKPGVLEDCNIPPSIYPLQSDGLTLKEIAEKVIEPFGLGLVVASNVTTEVNSTYDVSNAKETQTVKAYLATLSNQKNVLLSHTSGGSLLFTRANANQRPFADFSDGQPNTKMSLSFGGQAMHSDITVLKEAGLNLGNAGEATVSNPFVQVFRPRVIVQTSGTDNDTEQSAKNARADELRNIKLTITTDRWKVNDTILKPNTIITAISNKLRIPTTTKWFVEEVALTGTAQSQTATITCVLPFCYNGQEPYNVFR